MICENCGVDSDLAVAITWHDALDEKKDTPWRNQTLEQKQETIEELSILDNPDLGSSGDPLADEQMEMLQGFHRALSRDLASLEEKAEAGDQKLIESLWVDIYKNYLSAKIKVNSDTNSSILLKELSEIPCFRDLIINDGLSVIVSKSQLDDFARPVDKTEANSNTVQ